MEIEVYKGFVFVRLKAGLPSVAEMLAPYESELAAYRLEELQPMGRVTLRTRHVNWKNVTDNYSDGMHITVAHPGLTRLFGQSYGIEAQAWVDKMWGYLRDTPSSQRSERMYQSVLPQTPASSGLAQRLWTYFKLWPNVAFDIYPDQIDFMQMIPISPTETLIREIAYAHPDARREMRAARYLELAHQSPGERGGQGAHRARADRHGVAQLQSRARWAGTKCRCAVLRTACAISFRRAARTTPRRPAGQQRTEMEEAPVADAVRRDVVIIGGGHNGLVCAAYLAAAGLKVTVLERRGVVGGAAVTEEFHPGLSQFRGGIHRVAAQSQGDSRPRFAAAWAARRRAQAIEFPAAGRRPST